MSFTPAVSSRPRENLSPLSWTSFVPSELVITRRGLMLGISVALPPRAAPVTTVAAEAAMTVAAALLAMPAGAPVFNSMRYGPMADDIATTYVVRRARLEGGRAHTRSAGAAEVDDVPAVGGGAYGGVVTRDSEVIKHDGVIGRAADGDLAIDRELVRAFPVADEQRRGHPILPSTCGAFRGARPRNHATDAGIL